MQRFDPPYHSNPDFFRGMTPRFKSQKFALNSKPILIAQDKRSRMMSGRVAGPNPDRMLTCERLPLSRDGGTGRRSGLKIRRCLAPWGFNSPSRHQSGLLLYSEEVGKVKGGPRFVLFRSSRQGNFPRQAVVLVQHFSV